MNSQKIENLLNLTLDATMEEREQSDILNVGYDKEEKSWELIVKYQGNIERLQNETIQVEVLLNGYAIVTVPESLLDTLAQLEEIEYIEKPKNLIYGVYEARKASCMIPLSIGANALTGEGVLVAVLDSGIDYFLPDFQNLQGSRIAYLWDQSLLPDKEKGWIPPAGFTVGVEFTKEKIDEALTMPNKRMALELVPSEDISGHGTAVTSIAAGSNVDLVYRGVAPNSELIIVKLGNGKNSGLPRTTELMRGVTYCLRKAQELKKPLVVNLSFGNTYGAHDGSSILERFLDNASEVGRTSICVGSGNEGVSAGHTSGKLTATKRVELAVGNFETGINVQLWKHYVDRMDVTLIAPNGEKFVIVESQRGKLSFIWKNTTVLVYVGEPTPYSIHQEIFFDWIPKELFIDGGVWTFELRPRKIVVGTYQFYLPSQSVRSLDTRFITPVTEVTITVPATASKVISVGAYGTVFNAYADFSGRGNLVNSNSQGVDLRVKPDLVAPGVDILAARAGGGYEPVTGTSFATPMVTGVAAMLMEWGIVKGNDRYLYGEKLKANLIRNAKILNPRDTVPSEKIGWGALCVKVGT